jgi:hypothetical protein
MPNGPLRRNPDDADLIAFAEAVGNYSDVAAEAACERDSYEPPSGRIFDADASAPLADPGPEPRDPAESDPDLAQAIVPLLGMRMAVGEIDLGYARLVQAGELADAPEEVVGASNNVFASIECGHGPQAPHAASEGLRRVVTTLRLLKRGGVGLAAHGWSRDAGAWQRFSTGSGRPRPGGYELSRTDADELTDLSKRIAERRARTPAFAWALARFDLGAERPNQVEALSDYLLALRALLEGGGPAKAGLVARAAALVAGPSERDAERARIERATALERKLMSGDRVTPGSGSPIESIAETEELLRTLLRGMASGELGSDLRMTADEILLADGLRVGEGSASTMGGTAEWQVHDEEETAAWQLPDLEDAERIVAEHGEISETSALEEVDDDATREISAPDLFGPGGGFLPEPVESGPMEEPRKPSPAPWLSDDAERDLDWPSFAGPRPKGRERRVERNERVRYLFPKVDDDDWSVGELGDKRSDSA